MRGPGYARNLSAYVEPGPATSGDPSAAARIVRGRRLLAYQRELALRHREAEEQRDRQRRYAEAAGE